MQLAIISIILIVVLYYYNKSNLILFWLLLNLYLNPAGIISYHFGTNIIGPIKFHDIIFVLLFLTYFKLFKWKPFSFKLEQKYKKFLTYITFLLVYYFIVNLWLVPAIHGRGHLMLDNYIDARRLIYSSIVCLMVYQTFLKYGGKELYRLTLIVALLSFAMFLISYILKIPIVPVMQIQRYHDNEDLIRIGMISYGLFYWLIMFAWIFFFLKNKYFNNEKKIFNWTLISFIVFAIITLMTLTRRMYFELVLLPIIIYYIIKLYTPIKVYISKIATFFIAVIIVLSLISPSLLQNSTDIFKDTFLLIFTGEDTRGEGNYRLDGTGDLLLTKAYIAKNPILGQGYYYFNYEDKNDGSLGAMTEFAIASDAAREVPIYNVFFERGVFGFIIYIPYYFFLIMTLLATLKLVKNNFFYFMHFDKYSVLFILMLTVNTALTFSLRAYSLFGTYIEFIPMVYMGILFAAKQRLEVCIYSSHLNNKL